MILFLGFSPGFVISSFCTPLYLFKVSFKIITPLAVTVSLWSLFILSKILQVRLKKPRTGTEALLGQTGTAKTSIDKKGKVFIRGEIWDARSKEKIAKGEEIEVTELQGLVLCVKKRGG